MPDADRALRLRVRAAAILAGYQGLEGLAKDMGVPGASYATLKALTLDTPLLGEKIAAVSRHCAARGVTVPSRWLLEGFPAEASGEPPPPPDRPAMMSDLAELEARLAPKSRRRG